MNIIVDTYDSGRCYCRPDTTWEREDRDLFSPDRINAYLFSPVLFARVSKAGKCIGSRFADRYYDSVGYGMLLYAGDLFDGSPMAYACASCTDRSSVLPFPMQADTVLDRQDGVFSILKNGKEIFSTAEGSRTIMEESIVVASSLISLRIGDIVAKELAFPERLASRTESEETTVLGTFCKNELFRFRIIF